MEYIVAGAILILYAICIYGLIDVFKQINKIK